NHTAFRVLHLRPLGHATSPDEPAHRGYRTRTDLRNLRPCDVGHRHPCREVVRPAVVEYPRGTSPAREVLLRGAGGAVQPQTQGAPASHAPVTDVPGTSPRVHHSAAWFTPARETTSPDAYVAAGSNASPHSSAATGWSPCTPTSTHGPFDALAAAPGISPRVHHFASYSTPSCDTTSPAAYTPEAYQGAAPSPTTSGPGA